MRRKETITDPLDLYDGQTILIAYNLVKMCFSIRSLPSRKVVGYTDRIVLRNVRFVVSRAGRERVLRERVKNIHAYVQGQFNQKLQSYCFPDSYRREAYYNPYIVSTFVDKGNMKPIEAIPLVVCEFGKVYYSLEYSNSY